MERQHQVGSERFLVVSQAEAAWRARHKWAAQRLAHLLSDAHEKPPLRPAFDLLETLSLNIGLAIDGMAVGSFATPALATSGAGMTLESATDGRGWAAPGPGSRFSIVGSLRTHTPDPNAAAETSGRAVSCTLFLTVLFAPAKVQLFIIQRCGQSHCCV